jgi:hypothetical protein
MTKQIIKIVNVTTGQEIEREMDLQELEVYKREQLNAKAKIQAESQKAEARSVAEAKLIELGLTNQDLKALLG